MVAVSDYQVMPPLSAEQYAALREDIAAHGIRVPVDVDEDGAVLDGHHRAAIAAELGIDPPRRVVPGLTDEQKRAHAFAVNLHRRQLGPVSWAAAFAALAATRGVELGRSGRHNEKAATVAALAEEVGVPARTARRRLRLAEELRGHPDLATKVDTGELVSAKARGEVWKRHRAAATEPEPLPAGDPRIDVRHGDMHEVLADIEPGSVALIFTDPPYPAEFLPLYSDLAKLAAGWLRPGSRLVAYSGQAHLHEAMTRLNEHLRFQWVACSLHGGGSSRMWHPKVHCSWKPLLIYGTSAPSAFFGSDVLTGHREKRYHPWQQALAEARYVIEALTEPDDLVLDPFTGSGTTAAACQATGRRFLGCDTDAAAVRTARERLAAGGAP